MQRRCNNIITFYVCIHVNVVNFLYGKQPYSYEALGHQSQNRLQKTQNAKLVCWKVHYIKYGKLIGKENIMKLKGQ